MSVCACLVCVTRACTDPIDGVLRPALLAGSMCQWLIPRCLKGRPHLPSSTSPCPPVTPPSPPPQMGPFISPQNTNNGHWRIPKGWFTPFTPAPRLNAVMMQVVAEGGEKEDPTSKQTTENANKDFLHGCLSASYWIHEVLLCWMCPSPKTWINFMKYKATHKVMNRSWST